MSRIIAYSMFYIVVNKLSVIIFKLSKLTLIPYDTQYDIYLSHNEKKLIFFIFKE